MLLQTLHEPLGVGLQNVELACVVKALPATQGAASACVSGGCRPVPEHGTELRTIGYMKVYNIIQLHTHNAYNYIQLHTQEHTPGVVVQCDVVLAHLRDADGRILNYLFPCLAPLFPCLG